MPSDLDANYSATLQRLERLSESERALAELALLWVVQAQRPLYMQELIEALATPYEEGSWALGEWAKDGIVERELILHVCGGLLVQGQSGIVRLIRELLSGCACTLSLHWMRSRLHGEIIPPKCPIEATATLFRNPHHDLHYPLSQPSNC